MTIRNLRRLFGAFAVASVLVGCATGSTTTVFSQDDECRRAGGLWTGSRCDHSGSGGGGGGY